MPTKRPHSERRSYTKHTNMGVGLLWLGGPHLRIWTRPRFFCLVQLVLGFKEFWCFFNFWGSFTSLSFFVTSFCVSCVFKLLCLKKGRKFSNWDASSFVQKFHAQRNKMQLKFDLKLQTFSWGASSSSWHIFFAWNKSSILFIYLFCILILWRLNWS